mmetsp:Transcript_1759/g.3306  ORF Transcript_1759/g.3306 Transcript_1759/m.3306 type:complete len:230 (-) Transcript_1759:175-864(-)
MSHNQYRIIATNNVLPNNLIQQVTVPLSTTTLNALKDVIHTHPDLGPIQRKHQRLFHLGRELKSGNRSLKALGVGKFSVFLIHLHSLAPKTFDLQSDDDNDHDDYVRDDGIAADVGIGLKYRSEGGITNIDDDNDVDDDVVEIDGGLTNANSHSELKRNTQYRSDETESEHNNAQPTTGSSIHASRQSQQQSEKVVELLDSDSEQEVDDDDVEVVETVPTSLSKRRKFH